MGHLWYCCKVANAFPEHELPVDPYTERLYDAWITALMRAVPRVYGKALDHNQVRHEG